MRTGALDDSMAEVLLLQGRLDESRRQYREMLSQFETRLSEMRAGAQTRAMQDVQSHKTGLQAIVNTVWGKPQTIEVRGHTSLRRHELRQIGAEAPCRGFLDR